MIFPEAEKQEATTSAMSWPSEIEKLNSEDSPSIEDDVMEEGELRDEDLPLTTENQETAAERPTVAAAAAAQEPSPVPKGSPSSHASMGSTGSDLNATNRSMPSPNKDLPSSSRNVGGPTPGLPRTVGSSGSLELPLQEDTHGRKEDSLPPRKNATDTPMEEAAVRRARGETHTALGATDSGHSSSSSNPKVREEEADDAKAGTSTLDSTQSLFPQGSLVTCKPVPAGKNTVPQENSAQEEKAQPQQPQAQTAGPGEGETAEQPTEAQAGKEGPPTRTSSQGTAPEGHAPQPCSVLSPSAPASRVCSNENSLNGGMSPHVCLQGQLSLSHSHPSLPHPLPGPSSSGQASGDLLAKSNSDGQIPHPLLLLPSPSLPTLPSFPSSDNHSGLTLPLCGMGSSEGAVQQQPPAGAAGVEKTASCSHDPDTDPVDTSLSLSLGPPAPKNSGQHSGKNTPQTSTVSIHCMAHLGSGSGGLSASHPENLELAAAVEELSAETGGVSKSCGCSVPPQGQAQGQPPALNVEDGSSLRPEWLPRSGSGNGHPGALTMTQSMQSVGDRQGSPNNSNGIQGSLEFTLGLSGGLSDNISCGSQHTMSQHLSLLRAHPTEGGQTASSPHRALDARADTPMPHQAPLSQSWGVRPEPTPLPPNSAWATQAAQNAPPQRLSPPAPMQPMNPNTQGSWNPVDGGSANPGKKLMGVSLGSTSGQSGGQIKLLHIGMVGPKEVTSGTGQTPCGPMPGRPVKLQLQLAPPPGQGSTQTQGGIRMLGQNGSMPMQQGNIHQQSNIPGQQNLPPQQAMPVQQQYPQAQQQQYWQQQQQQSQQQMQPHQAGVDMTHMQHNGYQQQVNPAMQHPPVPRGTWANNTQQQHPQSMGMQGMQQGQVPMQHQQQQQWQSQGQNMGYQQQYQGQQPQQQMLPPAQQQAWQQPQQQAMSAPAWSGDMHMQQQTQAPAVPHVPQQMAAPQPAQPGWMQQQQQHQHPQQQMQHYGMQGQQPQQQFNQANSGYQGGFPQQQQMPLPEQVVAQNSQYYAPPQQQQQRQHFIGIRAEGGLWFADMEYSNKRITLGYRCTALEAAQLYDRAAYVLKGRDSELNLGLSGAERAELEQYTETSFLAKLAEENHQLWGNPNETTNNAHNASAMNPMATHPAPAPQYPNMPQQGMMAQQGVAQPMGGMQGQGGMPVTHSMPQGGVGAVPESGGDRVVAPQGGGGGRGRKRALGGGSSGSSSGPTGAAGNVPPGVRWVQSANKWLAYIRVNGSSLTLGYRKKLQDAAKLHDRAMYKLGEESEAAAQNLTAEERRELDGMSKKEFLAWVEVENARQRGYSSLFTGVSWSNMTKKWEAYIRVKGRQQYLGLFSCETDAALAYDKALLLRDGPNAATNAKRFPTIFDGLANKEKEGEKEKGKEGDSEGSDSDGKGTLEPQVNGTGKKGRQQSKKQAASRRGQEPQASSKTYSTVVQGSISMATEVENIPLGNSRPRAMPAQSTAHTGVSECTQVGEEEDAKIWEASRDLLSLKDKKASNAAKKAACPPSMPPVSPVPLEEGAGDTKDAGVPEEGENSCLGSPTQEMRPGMMGWAPVGSSGKKVGQFSRLQQDGGAKKKAKKLQFDGPRGGFGANPKVMESPGTQEAAMLLLGMPGSREDMENEAGEQMEEGECGALGQLQPNCLNRVGSSNSLLKHSGSSRWAGNITQTKAEADGDTGPWTLQVPKRRRQLTDDFRERRP